MNNYFQKVKDYIVELDYDITHENEEDGIFVVDHESSGIKNLTILIADPILIMEQFMFDTSVQPEVFQKLLQKNRDIISGAFALDESGSKVLFRDTLALENLDLNELEGSFNSLGLLLSEYSDELISFSKN